MGTRSQKRTVGASLWIIFKATKTRFGMRKSALQAGHLTSSLPSSNFSKRFASGVIVIWVWQPLHGTSIEPAQRSAPVKLISFLSSGIATPIYYLHQIAPAQFQHNSGQTHGWSWAQSIHWIGKKKPTERRHSPLKIQSFRRLVPEMWPVSGPRLYVRMVGRRGFLW